MLESLCPKQSRCSGILERGRLEKAAVQRIEGIVTGKVAATAPLKKVVMGLLN